MTPEELLVKAGEDMAEHGHYKGSFWDGPDRKVAPVCAYGALSRAYTGNPNYGETDLDFKGLAVIDQATKLLADTIGSLRRWNRDDWDTITNFNDDEDTSAEDMILAFKKAANHERI